MNLGLATVFSIYKSYPRSYECQFPQRSRHSENGNSVTEQG